MVGAGVCEWSSPDKTRAFIWWKCLDEWANDIQKFAFRTGEVEVVETVTHFQTEAGSPVAGMSEEVILRICNSVRTAFRLPAACCKLSVLRTEFYNYFGSWSAETKRSSWPRIQVTSAPCPAAPCASRPAVVTTFQLQAQLELDFTASSSAICDSSEMRRRRPQGALLRRVASVAQRGQNSRKALIFTGARKLWSAFKPQLPAMCNSVHYRTHAGPDQVLSRVRAMESVCAGRPRGYCLLFS